MRTGASGSTSSAARCSRSAIFVVDVRALPRQPSGIVNNGFTAGVGNVVQTAANKGVLLALVAMAQTFVVLTAGIDLSVGMIFILTNCRRLVSSSSGAPG